MNIQLISIDIIIVIRLSCRVKNMRFWMTLENTGGEPKTRMGMCMDDEFEG